MNLRTRIIPTVIVIAVTTIPISSNLYSHYQNPSKDVNFLLATSSQAITGVVGIAIFYNSIYN
jgi:hypothetical protein